MLTDERLQKLEGFNRNGIIRQEEIQELVDAYRTLQQQNKQMKEALVNINTHIGNITSTSFYHDAYIEVKQIAHKALQGGTNQC